ncbi:hypothetical protein NHX12_027360, partial [Muraenolepis orangiensis]
AQRICAVMLCHCDARGSVGDCSPKDGSCHCKPKVEVQACDRCKPGFFHLQQASPAGCQACFCFGHSLACSASTQHGHHYQHHSPLTSTKFGPCLSSVRVCPLQGRLYPPSALSLTSLSPNSPPPTSPPDTDTERFPGWRRWAWGREAVHHLVGHG